MSVTVHMIGNAHLDPVWLWQWQEGLQEVKATFRSALDRMNEFPDFVFTSSSAAYYEWVEQNDPAMFAEIRQRVAEGRWRIVGGWWVQADCNIPCGESFVRQALYAQRYFRAKLGVTARIGFCVDSFGHNGMRPQILRKSGMEAYVFMRPGAHEKGLSSPVFVWESDDGSQILAYRIPYEYCTWGKSVEQHIRRCASGLHSPLDSLMCFYGVGNHGGGPTVENIESIRKLQSDPTLPRLVFGSPEDFFDSMASTHLPIMHDELQHHASGCYAAHSAVKQWNRKAENLLLAAEKFSSLAAWLSDLPYPAELERAWKNVLFNQFHDILAGTSIEAAYDDARDSYGEAMAVAGRALNNAVQSISWAIRIEPEEGKRPIVVFNPHAWDSKVKVEVEVGEWKETNALVDDARRPVSFQLIRSVATAKGRYRVSFVADLPALGYRAYNIVDLSRSIPAVSCPAALAASNTVLENSQLRFELDPETGYIKSLFDKREQVEVFCGAAARPVVLDDPSDTWSHNVWRYDRPCGEFSLRRMRLLESGPVRGRIRVESVYASSTLTQDFMLYRDLDRIDVEVTVDWRERHKVLKLRFPLNLNNLEATYEIPYGNIQRPANGDEEPGQGWVDVSGLSRDNGDPYGLSLLNDGKYSLDVNIRDIGLTILRSPIYAHHMPVVPEEDDDYSYTDQGIQHFAYSLLPHARGWQEAGTVRAAAELNQGPISILESSHPNGRLPECDSFLQVDRENIVVSVLKQSEDNSDLILRCYETAQRATQAAIHLPRWRRTIKAAFGPCEIKTFRIPKDERQPVLETDFIEWEKT